jgi:hypothetical protein
MHTPLTGGIVIRIPDDPLPSKSMRTIMSECRPPLKMALGMIQISLELSSQRALILPPVDVINPLVYNSFY